MDCDPLLTLVAEPGDWRTCSVEVENLVPELLLIRADLLPRDWLETSAHDTFAPVVVPLKESVAGATAPFPSVELMIPIMPEAARRSLNLAVSEIYERKAKQLLYLVGRYVAGSGSVGGYDPFLSVDNNGRREQVRADAVIAIQAARKHVIVHTLDGQSMLHEPMHRVIAKLDPSIFLRIHRSVIVNCNRLDRVATATDKPSEIVMQDGSRYPVGRNFRQSISEYLQRLPVIS